MMRVSMFLLNLTLVGPAVSCAPPSMPAESPGIQASPACVTAEVQHADSDQDGIADECEFQLAQHFAPRLNVSSIACNVVGSGARARLGGGYRFAVQPTGNDTIRIAYMPAYFKDCGWSGPKCAMPGLNCAPHNGDSEFIAIEIVGSGSGRKIAGVFLSAHCFGSSTGSCKWYRGDALRHFEWDGGPTIWVAEGRNANYPSAQRCDRGHWWVDSCDGDRMVYVFPITAESNLGSRVRPNPVDGCIPAGVVDPMFLHTDRESVECFWTLRRFRGWQGTGSGVTGYSRYLSEVAGM